jgi:hypothetical protein
VKQLLTCAIRTLNANLTPRHSFYQGRSVATNRAIFQAYPSRHDETKTAYYRHSAFRGHFQRIEGAWFLEINPTYHFTWDGRSESQYYEENLKGIKRLERNPALLGQLLMWADTLSRLDDLDVPPYPYLRFGALSTVHLDWGIDDRQWLGHEEDTNTRAVPSDIADLPLFQGSS